MMKLKQVIRMIENCKGYTFTVLSVLLEVKIVQNKKEMYQIDISLKNGY